MIKQIVRKFALAGPKTALSSLCAGATNDTVMLDVAVVVTVLDRLYLGHEIKFIMHDAYMPWEKRKITEVYQGKKELAFVSVICLDWLGCCPQRI